MFVVLQSIDVANKMRYIKYVLYKWKCSVTYIQMVSIGLSSLSLFLYTGTSKQVLHLQLLSPIK